MYIQYFKSLHTPDRISDPQEQLHLETYFIQLLEFLYDDLADAGAQRVLGYKERGCYGHFFRITTTKEDL